MDELISQTQLAQMLPVNPARLTRWAKAGRLVPDVVTRGNRLKLYRITRLETLRQELATPLAGERTVLS
jgi:predicted site-specific integrase-resolvase